MVAGVVGGRLIGRLGQRLMLSGGVAVQGLAIVPLLFVGSDSTTALVIMFPALFVGCFAHVSGIVASTVTATSGLSDADQGLASGLVTMTQRVGTTLGTPLLSAVIVSQASYVVGMRLALGVAVVVAVVSAALIWVGLGRGDAEIRS